MKKIIFLSTLIGFNLFSSSDNTETKKIENQLIIQAGFTNNYDFDRFSSIQPKEEHLDYINYQTFITEFNGFFHIPTNNASRFFKNLEQLEGYEKDGFLVLVPKEIANQVNTDGFTKIELNQEQFFKKEKRAKKASIESIAKLFDNQNSQLKYQVALQYFENHSSLSHTIYSKLNKKSIKSRLTKTFNNRSIQYFVNNMDYTTGYLFYTEFLAGVAIYKFGIKPLVKKLWS